MGEKTRLGNRETANALNVVIYRNGSDAHGNVSDTLCVGNLFTVLLTFAVISLQYFVFSVCLRLNY